MIESIVFRSTDWGGWKQKMDKEYWYQKIKFFLHFFKFEIKRTTAIGHELILASKSNSQLNDAYHDLGKYTFQALQEGRLQWQDQKVEELCQTVIKCQQELLKYEEQLEKIKQQRPDSTYTRSHTTDQNH